MFCHECGTKVEDGWKFCPKCGTAIDNSVAFDVKTSNMLPGKKYECFNQFDYSEKNKAKARKYYDFLAKSEFKDSNAFYLDCFTALEDGTLVGFVYGHYNPKYKDVSDIKDYYYNLYRVDPDGTITFLNAGIRGGIENFYVQDGYAYAVYISGVNEMKAKIY